MMDSSDSAQGGRPPAAADGILRADIEAALNRLLCDLALDGAGGDDRAPRCAGLAALMRRLQSPALEARLVDLMSAADAAAWERTLTALADAWRQWLVHGDAVPAGAVPHDDAPGDGAAPAAPPPGDAPAAAQTRAMAESALEQELAALRRDPEMAAMFVEEALEHLGTIEASLLQLENDPTDVKLLNDIFRPFHTVKGNAMAFGLMRVKEVAHRVENLLDLCRSGRHVLGPPEIDAVLEAVDVLSALVRDTHARLQGQPGQDLEAPRHALNAKVDTLVEAALAGEAARTAVPAATPAANATPLAGPPPVPPPAALMAALPDPVPAEAAVDPSPSPKHPMRRFDDATGQASVKVDTRKLDNLVDMVGELVIAQSIVQEDPALLAVLDERLTRKLAQLKRITSDLQRNAMSMRLVPIRQTFQKMARLVRDLSKKSGKQVDLVLSGEDTELDRRVVEDINDPLMHMLRNSMDHGIESPDRRTASGKPAVGRLALSAFHQGGNVVIAIEDDGGGLNTERILAKAISQGLVAAGDALSTSEIHQLIFRPGFSTAEQITEISGRGVGMDVVRQNIDALRGRVEIHSAPGQGTRFLIKLPLTLAILDGLVLGVGTERFVMPAFAVRESLRPLPGQVHALQGQPRIVQVRDKLVPLVWLSHLFGIQGQETDACRAVVVVIEDDGRQVGLVVDELIGKQEVVIKSLGEAFGQTSGVAGGAILGDGRVGLILDAHGIVGRTHADSARAA